VMPAVFHEPPHAPIQPVLDGEVTSYFEWLGSGLYSLEQRQGAMHGRRFVVKELRYGSDGTDLFLRIDFQTNGTLDGLEIHVTAAASDGALSARYRLAPKVAELIENSGPEGWVRAAFHKVFESALSLEALRARPGSPVKLQLSIWQNGLPVDAVPPQGWLEARTVDPLDWPL